MPVLMNALDEVADLHPFIGVVVMAFKTVYTLELKRRDNESKVIALYVEMKDMMTALLQLKDVRDREVVGPSYQKVEDRMKTLIERTAEDIKHCSNTCDTYAKKRLLAKVFQGPFWDQKLLSFVELFTKRRAEFEFALSVHTSLGVEQANAKLDIVDVTTKALNDKMDNMLVVFQQMVNPEQKRLGELVRAKGGVRAIKESDILLAELDLAAHKISEHGAHDEDRHQHQTPVTPAAFDALKMDVFEAPDAAVEKNMVVFSRKFEVQKRQIIDELTLVVKREGDRVIEKVTSGPHERIVDQSIHEIWKEMGWRGNVKALHFVLALRDYYIDKLRSEAGSVRGVSTVVASRDPDAWAIAFIDVLNLQPILEAFDDDASGFITITEMNRFTSSRPLDWSLPHWVSFWAIGWKTSVIWYARRLENLFAKIDGITGQVLTPNREFVAYYQNMTWRGLHPLTAAVKGQEYAPSWDKFSSYVEAEEKRLENNLKAVDYVIDASDTLTLITGEGRLEKTIFPLLFLLVKHHFDIMRVACEKVVSERELLDGVSSIQCVMGAVVSRVQHLESIFLQQRLEPEKHFKTFAIGIYRYSYRKSNNLWTLDYMQSLETPVVPYDAAQEDENLDPQDVLKYKFQDELTLDDWVYDASLGAEQRDQNDTEGSALLFNRLLGQWHGYYYTENGEPESVGWDTMMSIVIERATDDNITKTRNFLRALAARMASGSGYRPRYTRISSGSRIHR
ncbi:hypothetical protein BC834DRAFT_942566 [Gloeopeniophorella convolvens]|nr:hypothetical protein BC834DRAFT_942566 [Gloeopeniophorella convolvens]